MAIALLVEGVESGLAGRRVAFPGQSQGGGLALVAQIQAHGGLDVRFGHAFGGQFGAAAPVQGPGQGVHGVRAGLRRQGLDQLPFARRVHQPFGGQHPGAYRHHRLAHAQVFGQGAHMEAAGAAEAGQGEVRRVEALLNGDHPQGLAHVLVGQVQNAPRGGFPVQAQAGGQPLHRRPGGVHVQGQAAGQGEFRLQAAQHHVGVGDRGLGAATAVAGRPRVGAGGLRAYVEQAGLVHPGQGAAAGADGVHVHHGHRHRVGADVAVPGEADVAVQQRHVRGGAAHVEGHQVIAAQVPAQAAGGVQAAGGAREQQVHGAPGGLVRGHGAAVGLHDGQR